MSIKSHAQNQMSAQSNPPYADWEADEKRPRLVQTGKREEKEDEENPMPRLGLNPRPPVY
jgi:hypothetical protein